MFYFEGEENEKEETIDNYKDVFKKYENNLPSLSEALKQLFISSGANKNEAEDLMNDILNKCKKKINENWEKIKQKYNKIDKNEAYIICSYTCESKTRKYSPYRIMNENLVSKNRKKGIENISKYFYIFLNSLRKLTKYYPKQCLYRCIPIKVSSLKDSNNENWVPYAVGNKKTFWAFTSTSPKTKDSFKFLDGEEIKVGTIFSLGGEIWGYDITLFNYFNEEEILLEPERKYKIDNFYQINNITHVSCKLLKSPLVLDNNNLIDTISNNNEQNDKINDSNINQCIVKIEMEIKINDNYKYILGVGFLCNITLKNMKVLITYNNIIDIEFLNTQKKLMFFINKTKIEIDMKISRYKNIFQDLGITIIEILDKDNVNNFIELDDYIIINNYNEENILLIHYKNKQLENFKDKIIKTKDNYSLNSIKELNEGIILLYDNIKMIGLINNIKKNIIPMNIIINKINYIKGIFEIKKEDIGKELQILNFESYIGNSLKKKKY